MKTLVLILFLKMFLFINFVKDKSGVPSDCNFSIVEKYIVRGKERFLISVSMIDSKKRLFKEITFDKTTPFDTLSVKLFFYVGVNLVKSIYQDRRNGEMSYQTNYFYYSNNSREEISRYLTDNSVKEVSLKKYFEIDKSYIETTTDSSSFVSVTQTDSSNRIKSILFKKITDGQETDFFFLQNRYDSPNPFTILTESIKKYFNPSSIDTSFQEVKLVGSHPEKIINLRKLSEQIINHEPDSIIFKYNTIGQVRFRKEYFNGGMEIFTTGYEYDSCDRLIKEVENDGPSAVIYIYR